MENIITEGANSTISTGGTTTGYYHIQLPQQGWECPRCRKINAPWLAQCPCPGMVTPTIQPSPFTWPPQTTSGSMTVKDTNKYTVIS